MNSLLVLAAGMGSRYGGLKQMDPLGPNGEFILDYSVRDALAAGIQKIVFVIRRDLEKDFREIVGSKWESKADIHYAFQEKDDLPTGFTLPPERAKPWGTAHAVLAARNIMDDSFIVVNADDYYGAEGFQLGNDFLNETATDQSLYAVVAYRLDKTLSKYSSVSRGVCAVDADGMLIDIEERLELQREADGIVRDQGQAYADDTPVSMNLFGFKRNFIDQLEAEFPLFLKDNISLPKSEYQMPTALRAFLKRGDARVQVMQTQSAWFGITSREDRAEVVEHLKHA